MILRGSHRFSVVHVGSYRFSVVLRGSQWVLSGSHRFLVILRGSHRFSVVHVGSYRFESQWFLWVLRGSQWYS